MTSLKLYNPNLTCSSCRHWIPVPLPDGAVDLSQDAGGECRGTPPLVLPVGPNQLQVIPRMLPKNYPICGVYEPKVTIDVDA